MQCLSDARADNMTTRNTHQILSSRVKLATKVTGLNVEQSLVNKTGDHGVVGSVKNLETLESTVEHDARATALLGAPGNLLAFSIGDSRIDLLGRPETKI